MKLLNSLKNIINKLNFSLKRFPLTILFSISVAALLIMISEINPTNDTPNKVAMTLALGIPLSLCTKLYFERKNETNILKRSIIYTLNIFLLILYHLLFLSNLEMVSITRYIAVSFTLYLSFIFIPFFFKKDYFEKYVIILLSFLLLTIIYSAVMYAGLSAILFAIDKLIGIHILSKVYYYTFLIVAFIFAIPYFLGLIPFKKEDLSVKPYPKALKVLLLYIVMPLLTVYTIILYIYLGKILVTRIWPIGMVSNLVLWYSIIVAIVLFFITPLKSTDKWAGIFFKFSPKIILPILIMMFISIGIRVNAYGITERRYYVLILALWVLCIMLYFSFIKNLRNILLPITLCLLSIISVFGPLSSFSVSKLSQNIRFEKILIENNMLVSGQVQSSTSISKEDKINISSILSYFNTNHSLKDVKYLPKTFKLDDMKNLFGFSYESPSNEYSGQDYFYINSKTEKAIDIKGYDYLFDMRSMNTSKNSLIYAVFNYETGDLKLVSQGKNIYQKNLNSFVKEIIDKHVDIRNEITLSNDEMTMNEENDKVKVKVVFLNISGRKNSTSQDINAKGNEFYILVKLK